VKAFQIVTNPIVIASMSVLLKRVCEQTQTWDKLKIYPCESTTVNVKESRTD